MDKVSVTDVPRLKRLVSRLSDTEISTQMKLWNITVTPPPLTAKSRTARIASLIENSFPEGMTLKQIAELDIRAVRQEGASQRWIALSTVGVVFLRADDLEGELSRHLSSFYKHHTAVFRFEDSLWIRTALYEGTFVDKLPAKANTVMLVYFPHHSRFLSTPIKKGHTRFFHQALCMTLGANQLVQEPLEGNNAASLAELLLNPQAQGPMMRYKRGNVDANPLDPSPVSPKKPKTKLPLIERVDADKLSQRSAATEEAFGSEPQAGFEKLTFEIRGKWRGPKLPLEGIFPVKIRFEGPNVVQGLRDLVSAGVLETPVPEYLANVHSLARNSFVVQDMHKMSEGDEAHRDDSAQAENSE